GVVRAMLHPRLESDEGRNRAVGCAENLGNSSAERWPAAWRLILFAATGHAHEIAVVVNRIGNRADNGEFVGDTRDERKMLANLDSGHVCGDGPEFATNFRRCVELEIEGVLMWWSTGKINHDHRFVRATKSRGRFRLKQLRQGQSSHAE